MSLARPWLLAIALSLFSGCAGAYITPAAHAPMMSEAGDVRVTAGARPVSPQRGMYAKATVAASKHVRLGAQVVGAHARPGSVAYAFHAYNGRGLYTFYAEGMAGFEQPGRYVTWGVLPSFGYAVTEVRENLCAGNGKRGLLMACERGDSQQLEGSYFRSGLEGYVGFRPIPWAHLAFGVRAAWVHLRAEQIDGAASQARFDFAALDPFAAARLEYGGFSGELQLRYSNFVNRPHDAEGDRLLTPSHASITVGVGVRFPRPPKRWPAGHWRRDGR